MKIKIEIEIDDDTAIYINRFLGTQEPERSNHPWSSGHGGADQDASGRRGARGAASRLMGGRQDDGPSDQPRVLRRIGGVAAGTRSPREGLTARVRTTVSLLVEIDCLRRCLPSANPLKKSNDSLLCQLSRRLCIGALDLRMKSR